MPRRSISATFFAFAAILATAMFCVAAPPTPESNPLVGKWNMISSTSEGGQVSWTLTIHREEGKYSAIASSDDGEGPVKDFKVDGRNVTLIVPYQGQDYEIKLKLVEDKLSGTWSGSGDSGDTTGKKAAAPVSQP